MAFYKKAKYKIEHLSDEKYYRWAQQFAGNNETRDNENRFLIDISSMSRYRIAALVWALASCAREENLWVDFLYSFAKYNRPPRNTGPITNIGPILSDFAGWFEEPSSTCSAIIGLGYDLGKSVGTIEYIEPGEIWAMNPIGKDKRYEKSVLKANKLFLDVLEEYRIIDYEVFRPFETYSRLESLVSGAMGSSRPVIIPFGPKIFTLCSLLVAINKYPKISVWRVSSGKYEPVANRVPSGTVVGLRVLFHQKGTTGEV